jgi:RNA polymerase sigma factor (sigma-70 family)
MDKGGQPGGVVYIREGVWQEGMGSVTNIREPAKQAEFVSRLQRQHGVQLEKHLMRLLGRKEAAEEIAQEAYFKLYRLSRPDEVESPRALLFDVATKLALTRLKRVRIEAARMATPGELEEVLDESPPLERRVMAEEAMQHLAAIVADLTPGIREVFVMRYVQQMPRQEIAERLNTTVGAVEQRLTRALTQCRERLAALGIDRFGLD